MKPISIVIVGGGTAGWITANVLMRRLSLSPNRPVRITLVESKRIGIVGVGEATVPSIKSLLRLLGISEEEFLRETNGTFKHGILFRDWAHEPGTGRNETYFHPFDNMAVLNFSPALWWLAERAHLPGANYAEDVCAQYTVALNGRAPRRHDIGEYEGVQSYAYHIDAERLAEFLASRATRAGVVRIFDDVVEVRKSTDGSVESIVAREHGMIEGDFFVDCTGFAGLLLTKTLGVGFVSYNNILFCDRAVAFRVPTEKTEPVRPFTSAVAKSAGWIWEIDLQKRRGTGHVYSSNHMSPEDAEAELRRHIGPRSNDLQPLHIRMRVGRSESFWKKNVAAIGLAGGFIEPLESTGIYLIESGAIQLAQSLEAVLGLARQEETGALAGDQPSYSAALGRMAEIYNRQMIERYEELRDFIKIHYFLTKRRDTAFWRDNAESSSVSDRLLGLMDRWQTHPPQTLDFPERLVLFTEYNWLYIMLGMGWVPKSLEGFRHFVNPEAGDRLMTKVKMLSQRALSILPDQRAYFDQAEKVGPSPQPVTPVAQHAQALH